MKNDVALSNRYSTLANNEEEPETRNSTPEEKIQKPAPIFVYGVKVYSSMETSIKEILNQDQYHTKTVADNVIKINPTTIEAYRALAKYLMEKNVVHHMYHPKENRVVIKYVFHRS